MSTYRALFLLLSLAMTASVVVGSEFLAADPGIPGSIPGTTKFSVMELERGPLNLVRIIELLEWKVGGSGLEN
jgi:hypothetical protein